MVKTQVEVKVQLEEILSFQNHIAMDLITILDQKEVLALLNTDSNKVKISFYVHYHRMQLVKLKTLISLMTKFKKK